MDEVLKFLSDSKIVNSPFDWNLQGGSDLSECAKITTKDSCYFLKCNTAAVAGEMFSSEAFSLRLFSSVLSAANIPQVVSQGESPVPFILMEYLNLKSGSNQQAALGSLVAKLHQHTAEKFGFPIDTFCGTTRLDNTWNSKWSDFWISQRLKPLMGNIDEPNLIKETLEKSMEILDAYPGVKPSLLHGDLWSGNWAVRSDLGHPVIYDPACYFGHNEVDLGIMRMFGGFTKEFFESYHKVWPVTPGFEERANVYELFHHLNHLKLFGSGYQKGCVRLMQRICNY